MKMLCKGVEVRKEISSSQQTEIIIGKSQYGKTFYASSEAKDIIVRKDYVHMIDLCNSWSAEDKARLGNVNRYDFKQDMVIYMPSRNAAVKCASYIANAFGFISSEVISVLKEMITFLLDSLNGKCSIYDLLILLKESSEDKTYAFKKAANKAYVKMSSSFSEYDIKIVVDDSKAEDMVLQNAIWDLSVLDKEGASMVAQMIMFAILETRRNWFKNNTCKPRTYVIIDEFQNIDCTKASVVGVCLTEAQRVNLYLILISQFIDGKYSDAVVHQLKQGGHFLYFRVTEDEAPKISKQLAYNVSEQEKIQRILTTLPRGYALYKGRHYLGKSKNVSENIRIIEVVGEKKEV